MEKNGKNNFLGEKHFCAKNTFGQKKVLVRRRKKLGNNFICKEKLFKAKFLQIFFCGTKYIFQNAEMKNKYFDGKSFLEGNNFWARKNVDKKIQVKEIGANFFLGK